MQYITQKLRSVLWISIIFSTLSLPLHGVGGRDDGLRQRRGLPQQIGLQAAQAALRIAPTCARFGGSAALTCLRNPVAVLLTAGYGFAFFGPGTMLSMVPMPEMIRHLTNLFLTVEQSAVAAHALTVINQNLAAQAFAENNPALLQYSLELSQLLRQIPQLETIANIEIRLEPRRLVEAVENSQWDMAEVLVARSAIDLNHDRGFFLRRSLAHIVRGDENALHAHAFAQHLIRNPRLDLTTELFFAVLGSNQEGLITLALDRADLNAASPMDGNNIAHLCAQNPRLRALVGVARLAGLAATTYNQESHASKLPVEVMFSAFERGDANIEELRSYIASTTDFHQHGNALFRRALAHDGMRAAGIPLALVNKEGAIEYQVLDAGEYPLDLALRLGDAILFNAVLGHTPLAILQNKHLSELIVKRWDPRPTAWKLLIQRQVSADGDAGAAAATPAFVVEDRADAEEVMPADISFDQILQRAGERNRPALLSYYSDPYSNQSGSILVHMVIQPELFSELIFRDAYAKLLTDVANPLLTATPATGGRSLLSHLATMAGRQRAVGGAPHPMAAVVGQILSESERAADLLALGSADRGNLFPLMMLAETAAPFLAAIATRADADRVLTPFLMCVGASCSDRVDILAIDDASPVKDPSRPPTPAIVARGAGRRAAAIRDRTPAPSADPETAVALTTPSGQPGQMFLATQMHQVALVGNTIMLCGLDGKPAGQLVAREHEILASYALHDAQAEVIVAHDLALVGERIDLGTAAAAAHADAGLPPTLALVLSPAPAARTGMPMRQQVGCTVGLVGMDLVKNWDAVSYTLSEFGIIDPSRLSASEGFMQRWADKASRIIPYYGFAVLVASNLDSQRPLLGSAKIAAKVSGVYAVEKALLLPSPSPSQKPLEERGAADFIMTYSPYLIGAAAMSVVQTGAMVLLVGTSGMGLPVAAGSLIAKEAAFASLSYATPCLIAYIPQQQSNSLGSSIVPKLVGAAIATAGVMALTPVLGLASGAIVVTVPVAGLLYAKAAIGWLVIFAPTAMITRMAYNAGENYFAGAQKDSVNLSTQGLTVQAQEDKEFVQVDEVETNTKESVEENPDDYEL